MCDPMTMMAVGSTALKAGTSIASGFSGSKAGRLQAMLMQGNAALMRKNAEVAVAEGDYALAKGAYQETRVQDRLDSVLGTLVSGWGARGMDPSFGSPLVTQAASVAQAEVDIGMIRANSMLEKAGAGVRAANAGLSAASMDLNAASMMDRVRQNQIAGLFGAGAAMLEGVSKWPGLNASAAQPKGMSATSFAADPWGRQLAPINASLGGIY